MKKIIQLSVIILATFLIRDLQACSFIGFDFPDAICHYDQASVFTGKILQKGTYYVDIQLLEVHRGCETDATIRIWDGETIDCNGPFPAPASALGAIGDSVLFLAQKIDTIINPWDVIGAYRRPIQFGFDGYKPIKNGSIHFGLTTIDGEIGRYDQVSSEVKFDQIFQTTSYEKFLALLSTNYCLKDTLNCDTDKSVFEDFPWLAVLADTANCTTEQISVYESGGYNFILVSTVDRMTKLYFEDGTFYCQQTTNYNCVTAYNLGNPIKGWVLKSDCAPITTGCAYAETLRFKPCDPEIIETALYEYNGKNYVVSFPANANTIVDHPTVIRNCTDGSIYCTQLFTGCENFFQRATKLEVLTRGADCSACTEIVVGGGISAIFISNPRTAASPHEALVIQSVQYINKANREGQVAQLCPESVCPIQPGDTVEIPVEVDNGNNEFEVQITFKDGLICQYDIRVVEIEDCICTADENPVCGVDGKTYSNACLAACAGVEVAFNSPCMEVEENCDPFITLPIGTDLCGNCYEDISVYQFRGEHYVVYKYKPNCQPSQEFSILEYRIVNCNRNAYCSIGEGLLRPEPCLELLAEATFVQTLWTDANCLTTACPEVTGTTTYTGTIVENECGIYIQTADNQYLTADYTRYGGFTEPSVGSVIAFDFVNVATSEDACLNQNYGAMPVFGYVSCLNLLSGDCTQYTGTVIKDGCGRIFIQAEGLNEYGGLIDVTNATEGSIPSIGSIIQFNFERKIAGLGLPSCGIERLIVDRGTIECLNIIEHGIPPGQCQISITNTTCRLISIHDEKDNFLVTIIIDAPPNPGIPNPPPITFDDPNFLSSDSTRKYIFKINKLVIGSATVSCDNSQINVVNNYDLPCNSNPIGFQSFTNIGCRTIDVFDTEGIMKKSAAPGEVFDLDIGFKIYILKAGNDTLVVSSNLQGGAIDSGGCETGSNFAIFNDYPWLTDLIDPNNCTSGRVEVYQAGIYNYLRVSALDGSAMLYSQDGLFYCQESANYNCVDAYNLGAPIASWTCSEVIAPSQCAQFTGKVIENVCGKVLIQTEGLNVASGLIDPIYKEGINPPKIGATIQFNFDQRGGGGISCQGSVIQVALGFIDCVDSIENTNNCPSIVVNLQDGQLVIEEDPLSFFAVRPEILGDITIRFTRHNNGVGVEGFIDTQCSGVPCSLPVTIPVSGGVKKYTVTVPLVGADNCTYIIETKDNNSVFESYPFLDGEIDRYGCNVIEVYDQGSHAFVFLRLSPNRGRLYLNNGTFYCETTSTYDCLAAYGLGIPTNDWACSNLDSSESAERTIADSKQLAFMAFPNPTTGRLTIQIPASSNSESQLYIHDMLGRTMHHTMVDGGSTSVELNIADYDNGVYYVELRNKGQRMIKKVVKQDLK